MPTHPEELLLFPLVPLPHGRVQAALDRLSHLRTFPKRPDILVRAGRLVLVELRRGLEEQSGRGGRTGQVDLLRRGWAGAASQRAQSDGTKTTGEPTRDDLEELGGLGANDASPVDFGDEMHRVGIEEPARTRSISGDGSESIRDARAHLSVSPNGPIMTTVRSHATTTELLPHHSTCRGGPRSPSPTSGVIGNSERDRAKSEEATQSCGGAGDGEEVDEDAGGALSRARKRPLGDGEMERKGPRARRCGEEQSGQSEDVERAQKVQGRPDLVDAVHFVETEHGVATGKEDFESMSRAGFGR